MALLLEESFEAEVASNAGVKAIIDNRIYPLVMPQNASVPAITYFKLSAPRDYTHDGPTGTVRTTVRCYCWAPTYRQAKLLAEALRKCLSGFSGRLGGADGASVGAIFLADEHDFFAFDEEESNAYFYVMVDYQILHSEG